jgi:hypothetical protein
MGYIKSYSNCEDNCPKFNLYQSNSDENQYLILRIWTCIEALGVLYHWVRGSSLEGLWVRRESSQKRISLWEITNGFKID